MISSRLTRKAQTTIPRPVRHALRLSPGDEIVYRIEGDQVVLSKAAPVPGVADDPFAAFVEWGLDADTKGYAGF